MRMGRVGNLAISAGISIGLAVMHHFLDATKDNVYIGGRVFDFQCFFKKYTGIPCPGCGGTRSFVMALHGDFYQSILMNPLGFLLLVGIVLFGVIQLFLFADSFGYCRVIVSRIRGLFEPRIIAFTAYSLVAVALGQWIIKLIPH